jgi:hypothetical protein
MKEERILQSNVDVVFKSWQLCRFQSVKQFCELNLLLMELLEAFIINTDVLPYTFARTISVVSVLQYNQCPGKSQVGLRFWSFRARSRARVRGAESIPKPLNLRLYVSC